MVEVIRIQQTVQVRNALQSLQWRALHCIMVQCSRVHTVCPVTCAPSNHSCMLQVAEWLQQHSLLPERDCGQYSSERAWRSRLTKRRDASAPLPLFIASLQLQLEAVVCPPFLMCRLLNFCRMFCYL